MKYLKLFEQFEDDPFGEESGISDENQDAPIPIDSGGFFFSMYYGIEGEEDNETEEEKIIKYYDDEFGDVTPSLLDKREFLQKMADEFQMGRLGIYHILKNNNRG